MTKAPAPPPGGRLRRLSDEEIDLWRAVAESVSRREGSRLPDRVSVPAPVAPVTPVAVLRAPPPAIPAGKPKPPPLAPLERRLKQKLARGKATADAAIDLHGLRQAEAYGALLGFLRRQQGQGARVVIVVTGKGGRPTTGISLLREADIGVLRRSVPLWLAMPDFRPMVIGFEEAARHHGGAGALYVRLRRGG